MKALRTPTAAVPSLEPGIDVFGRVASASLWMAAILAFGLMPFLWAEVRSVPSQTWTGLGILLMAIAAVTNRADKLDDRRITTVFVIFMCLYGAGMLFNYLFLAPAHEDRFAVLTYNLTMLVLASVFYAFGVVATSPRAWPGFAIALAIVSVYVMQHRAEFALDELYRRFEADQVNIGYQQIGDTLLMGSLVLIARFRRLQVVYPLSVFVVVLLFIIPSRSAAVFGAISLLVAAMLVSTLRVRIVIGSLALLSAIGARVWIAYQLEAQFQGTRHETLLTVQEDSSNQARMDMLDKGIDSILQNPIFGRVGYELDSFNERGSYIHNLLDVWGQAGLLPFLALLVLLVLIGRQWGFMFKFDREAAYRCLPFLVFGLLSWVIARSMHYPQTFFVLGFFSATLAASLAAPQAETELDRALAALRKTADKGVPSPSAGPAGVVAQSPEPGPSPSSAPPGQRFVPATTIKPKTTAASAPPRPADKG